MDEPAADLAAIRDAPIYIRMTAAERNLINAAARAAGKSTAKWARDLLLLAVEMTHPRRSDS